MKTALTSLTALLITGIATAQTTFVTNLTGVTQIEMYHKDGSFALKNGGLYHFGTNSFRVSYDHKRTVDGFYMGTSGQATFIPPEFQSGVLKFSVGAQLAVALKEGGRVVVFEDINSDANGNTGSFLSYPFPPIWKPASPTLPPEMSGSTILKNGAVHYLGEPDPGQIEHRIRSHPRCSPAKHRLFKHRWHATIVVYLLLGWRRRLGK